MLERLKTSCPKDVRWFHACFCTSFLGMGLLALGFSISVPRIGLIFAVGLATQFAFLTARKLKVGYMSAIISCISLSLLLRGDRWWVFALAPLAAIASKFLIRWNDKHLFNPTNFAVVLLLLATEHAWVTPSQWGTSVLLGAWIAILGVTVAARAGRSDVSWTFLACFLGLKLLRATSLGQGPETVLPLLKSGALLLFTFFMINDPRTTPNASRARVLFAVTTAVLAFAWGDLHGGNNAPFYALLVMTPLTPLMDKRWKGPKHVWTPAPEAVPAR